MDEEMLGKAMATLRELVAFRDGYPWTGLADDDAARRLIEDARDLVANYDEAKSDSHSACG